MNQDFEPENEDTELVPVNRKKPEGGTKHEKFEQILKSILPQIGTNEGKIILAQIILALKLEKVIGKDLTYKDEQLVKTIKEAVMGNPDKKQEALQLAKNLLKGA